MRTATDRPTSGRVNGQAQLHDYVHYCDMANLPGRLYCVIADNEIVVNAGRPERSYMLHDVTTGDVSFVTVSDLKHPGWTFHPQPNTVIGVTTDGQGNRHTWHLHASPMWDAPAWVETLLLTQHRAMFDVSGEIEIDHWYWAHRENRP